MRRWAFVFNRLAWWRAMPIGVSCLLHAGLIGGLVVSQHWLISAAAVQPPVLPVQLVTLDAAEPPREPPPPAPPRPERPSTSRRPEAPRRPEPPAARAVETAPPPVVPAPAAATPAAPAEIAPAPAPPATLPVIDEPPPGPDSRAPEASGPPAPPLGLPAPQPPPPVSAKPPGASAEGITRTARPHGGYQVRPAYPSVPRRLGIQGTTLLRVHVLADGRIGDVLVERSAGHSDLDRAAMDAVRRWRFEPARRGDDAVAMWVLLPVEFRLTQ
jgi:protein TonB